MSAMATLCGVLLAGGAVAGRGRASAGEASDVRGGARGRDARGLARRRSREHPVPRARCRTRRHRAGPGLRPAARREREGARARGLLRRSGHRPLAGQLRRAVGRSRRGRRAEAAADPQGPADAPGRVQPSARPRAAVHAACRTATSTRPRSASRTRSPRRGIRRPAAPGWRIATACWAPGATTRPIRAAAPSSTS